VTSATARSTPPRPLPRALIPHPEETLAGYLINTAYYLDSSPVRVAVRIGLVDTPPLLLPHEWGLALTPEQSGALQVTCHLTSEQVRGLTLSRYAGTLYDPSSVGVAARTAAGTAWWTPQVTRYCPACLGDTPAEQPGRVTWQAVWRTPWLLSCPEHRGLLRDTCPACHTPVGSTGTRLGSLVPRAAEAVAHPDACRANINGTLCGYRLSHDSDTEPAPDAVQDANRHLNQVLTHPGEPTTTLGSKVTAAQYLRDLRLIAVVLQAAVTSTTDPLLADLPPLPGMLDQPLDKHLRARSQKRERRGREERNDRTWTSPPSDHRVTAGLLVHGTRLLDLPRREARPQLAALIRSAEQRETLLWRRVRSAGQPSDALATITRPTASGRLGLTRIRAALPASTITLTSGEIPGWLPEYIYLRVFPAAPANAAANIRRAVSLVAVQLLDSTDLSHAANTLGMTGEQAQAALIRAGRAAPDNDTFTDSVAQAILALDTSPHQPYGARRDALRTWQIPPDDWQDLQARLLAARLARTDTPWPDRYAPYTAWVWSVATGGDPALAPCLTAHNHAGRRTTDGNISTITTLARRGNPALINMLNNYAHGIINQLDGTT